MLVDPMKATVSNRITTGHMITVVGELFARRKSWSFANDFVAFDNELASVGVGHHPFSAEQRDRAVRAILDGDEVDERMWLIRRE